MRKGRLWVGAGLGLALLLSSNGLRGDEPLGPPTGTPKPIKSEPGAQTHETVPHPSHEVPHEADHGNHGANHEGGHGESCEEGGGFYVIADYLLVRPRRRPHDFVIVDPVLNSAAEGRVASLDWETQSAYRIAAGYHLWRGVEIGAIYTYIHSKDDQSLAPPVGGALYATLSAPISFDEAASAVARSNLDMDVIDVELAKRFDLTDDLWIRLSGGPRFATIQQKLNAVYDFSAAGIGTSIVDSPINFDGYGIRVGGLGEWQLGCGGLGLWGKMYASILTGDFRTRLTQTINGGTTVIVNVEDKFTKLVPVTEVGLGVAYTTENFRLSVGYELSNWFGLVDSVDFVEGTSFGKIGRRAGDLSLEALTVSFGVFF